MHSSTLVRVTMLFSCPVLNKILVVVVVLRKVLLKLQIVLKYGIVPIASEFIPNVIPSTFTISSKFYIGTVLIHL